MTKQQKEEKVEIQEIDPMQEQSAEESNTDISNAARNDIDYTEIRQEDIEDMGINNCKWWYARCAKAITSSLRTKGEAS